MKRALFLLPVAVVCASLYSCAGCGTDDSLEAPVISEKRKEKIVQQVKDSTAARVVAEQLTTAAEANPTALSESARERLNKRSVALVEKIESSAYTDQTPEDFLQTYEALVLRMESQCDTTGLYGIRRDLARDPIVAGWKQEVAEFQAASRALGKRRKEAQEKCGE